jgi:hypothetical protein
MVAGVWVPWRVWLPLPSLTHPLALSQCAVPRPAQCELSTRLRRQQVPTLGECAGRATPGPCCQGHPWPLRSGPPLTARTHSVLEPDGGRISGQLGFGGCCALDDGGGLIHLNQWQAADAGHEQLVSQPFRPCPLLGGSWEAGMLAAPARTLSWCAGPGPPLAARRLPRQQCRTATAPSPQSSRAACTSAGRAGQGGRRPHGWVAAACWLPAGWLLLGGLTAAAGWHVQGRSKQRGGRGGGDCPADRLNRSSRHA